jgi:hypothetical protein
MSENNNWVMRNVTDDYRVKDMIELYESMGFEIKVENFRADDCNSECNECMVESPEKFKVIYTRRNEQFNDLLFEEIN